MSTSHLEAISPKDTFCFECHPGMPCFNQCCRDLNQALTPYDIVRLRSHLNTSSGQFLRTYTTIHTGPATGLPIVSLCFTSSQARACPFVTPEGCRVYAARPSSCRMYPLARALQRSRVDGSLSEHYAILHEVHCQGFKKQHSQSVGQWIASQQLAPYNVMNDMLMELIALKNRLRPGFLSPDHQQMVITALYDLDRFKQQAISGQSAHTAQPHDQPPLPSTGDDEAWLRYGMEWVRRLLFGEME